MPLVADIDTTDGHEPDYRYTLANERTFLAWVRTSFAFIAGGVALMQLPPGTGLPGLHALMAGLLLLGGGLLAPSAVRRWNLVQAAMRADEAIPSQRLPMVIGRILLPLTAILFIVADIVPAIRR
ncbi:MAG: DUF202 domain-containing protein [Mycobacterium sp.]